MTFANRGATLLALTLACALSGGCATRLTSVGYYDTGLGYSGADYHFDSGALLKVMADQGVANFSLGQREGTFRLNWIGERWSGSVPTKTFALRGESVFEAGPDGSALGGGEVLLLQGNGESRWTTVQEAEYAIASNARAYLGVSMNSNQVILAHAGSPAQTAGLLKGDRILAAEVHGERVALEHRLRVAELLLKLHPQERITLIVEREGKEIALPVVLEERPRSAWNKTDA